LRAIDVKLAGRPVGATSRCLVAYESTITFSAPTVGLSPWPCPSVPPSGSPATNGRRWPGDMRDICPLRTSAPDCNLIPNPSP